jgi:hypothetical protein
MVSIRTGFWVVGTILLAGCATANVKPRDLSALGSAPTADQVAKITHGSPLYRLDYLAGGHTFIYETYEASDTERYYGLLFQDGKLDAVDLTGRGAAYSPGLRACTLFPPKPGLDVDRCFQDFNRDAETIAVKVDTGVTPDQAAKRRSASGTADTVAMGAVETAMFAPVLIPIAAVTLPVMGVAAAGDKSRRESLDVKLGDAYANVRGRVEQYPDKYRSITDGSGTVLIPGAVVPNAAAAFGVDQGKVIWIDLSPGTSCGGGFFFWGMNCEMGFNPPVVWRAPHRPRPPVIDEWENVAVYYTAPPQFDVLGETRGKAGRGFTAKARLEDALEDMKKAAREDGATGLLLYPLNFPVDKELTAAPAAGTGAAVYGPPSDAPFGVLWVRGLEIYVPADAAAFHKAAQVHATTCDALSQKKDDAKDAYKALKGTGTPADIDAAKAKLQAAEDASDAAYCGDDPWYAEQMEAQKH